MKVVLALLVVLAAVTADKSAHVNQMLAAVAPHKGNNPMFSELEAQVLNAAEVDETEEADETEEKRRSPVAEISSMTDMMLIQTNAEIGKLVRSHKRTQKKCRRDLSRYSRNIALNKRGEKSQLERAMGHRRTWEVDTHKIPPLNKRILKLRYEIKRESDVLEAAQSRRDKRHQAFIKAVAEHDSALQDIQKIRAIIQNSKLDDRSNKQQTVSGGKKQVAVTHHGGKQNFTNTLKKNNLLELKQEVHPKLQDVVLLAHQAVSSGSGIDLIYRLLYQTRDQLTQSKEKLIKSEKTAIGNWRRNKLAFAADINDLRIDIATTYMNIGTIKNSIGTDKLKEGNYKIAMQRNINSWTKNQINKDFLEVVCADDRASYSTNLATKRNEKAALETVQRLLVNLKWSPKVYSAIQTVSEGIVYLKGFYNIRSAVSKYRYMTNSKGAVVFATKGNRTSPEKFEFKLNNQDLSFYIKSKIGKNTYFLTETSKGNVKFTRIQRKKSSWNVEYDNNSGNMFIRNKVTKMALYASRANGFRVNTREQTQKAESQFFLERPNYRQKGCYKNKVGHQLEHYLTVSNTLNTGKCYKACVKHGKKKNYTPRYFGLTEGKQCYCGTKFDKTKAPMTDCGVLCNGRSGELCGGDMRTMVYTISSNYITRPQ